MNLKQFQTALNNEEYRNISNSIRETCQKTPGFSAPYGLQILSLAVKCMEQDEQYLEVGTFRGRSLVGAMIDNKDKVGTGIDNFSELTTPDKVAQQEKDIIDTIKSNNLDKVQFIRADYRNFIPSNKVGVYFYDGNHNTDQGLAGLEYILPHLSANAVIIVDDLGGIGIWKSVIRFCYAHQEYVNIMFAMSTPDFPYGNPTWWNGIAVLCYNKHEGIERRTLIK